MIDIDVEQQAHIAEQISVVGTKAGESCMINA